MAKSYLVFIGCIGSRNNCLRSSEYRISIFRVNAIQPQLFATKTRFGLVAQDGEESWRGEPLVARNIPIPNRYARSVGAKTQSKRRS